MASIQRQTALAFLQTFENLDLEANIALRTDDCRHDMAPASLGYTKNQTNEEFAAHFKITASVLSSFPVMAKEIFEVEGSNQVTVWATGIAGFREDLMDDGDPSVDWTYHGEYMFLFFFDESGKRIRRIVEFLDSQRVVGVRALVQRARRNQEGEMGDLDSS